MSQRGIGFWLVQGPGWLLVGYLAYAQGIAAFDYDLGVALGTQEPAAQITPVGVAFWWAFAFADVVFYLPLLIAGLIGHWLSTAWAKSLLSAALAITVYWPIVSLAAVYAASGADGWSLPKESEYWLVLPVIAAWAAWALWRLVRSESSDP